MHRKKTALIVDDSAFTRRVIKGILNRCGFRVVGEAENGNTCIEKYKLLRPDIVTLDIVMDEASGLLALEQIIAHNPDAIVVIISAMTGQVPFVVEANAKGAAAIVTKPIEENDLIEALSSILSRLLGTDNRFVYL